MCKSSPGAAPGEVSAAKVAAEHASAHDLFKGCKVTHRATMALNQRLFHLLR
jgi:hypothetical protein